MILAIEPLLSLFLQTQNYQISELTSKIKEVFLSTYKLPLERIIYLRKYSGKDNLKGILDYLPKSTTIREYNDINDHELSKENQFILGPLNMEELTSYYRKIFKNSIPTYPIVHPILASKFYRNVMFDPFIPFHIYIPESSINLISRFDFESYFSEKNVSHVIIKDEYGFHTGQMVAYQLVPVGSINKKIIDFAKIAGRIEDFGGIIIEEFIGDLESEVYKCHIYGEIIPKEIIKYKIYLDGLEGVFKSYTPGEKSLLQKVDSEVGEIDQDIINKLNPIIKQHLPYLFASLDFIIDKNNKLPKVIDVNSIAGSLGEVQEMIRSNDHNSFEFFYNRCLNLPKNEFRNQIQYLDYLENQYYDLKTLEGIFSVKDGKKHKLL
ncbi:MAG: hypothetical protein HeimC3_52940 [Candidatus Heimdallarchaeota archaeon LC_3]|nr:MAG: hypothetical protein HeimC3_52940 [Candidatus Heimdallarchaeota archaeon LC_3]